MRKLLLLLPLLFASVSAQAATWHKYGEDTKGHSWLDVTSIHTHKGITYFNGAFSTDKYAAMPEKSHSAFYGGNVNCRARINPGGFYVRSREEQQKRSNDTPQDVAMNEIENRLLELVCPEGTLSPDIDTAMKFL